MARLNSLSFNDDGVSGTFRFFSHSQFGEFGRLVTASFLSEKFETDFLNLSDLNVCQVCVLSPGVISGSEKAWPPRRGLSQLSLLSRLFFLLRSDIYQGLCERLSQSSDSTSSVSSFFLHPLLLNVILGNVSLSMTSSCLFQ